MGINIEKNIAMPLEKTQWKVLALKMEIGDSIVLTNEQAKCLKYQLYKLYGIKSSFQKTENRGLESVRVWRIK